MRHLDLLPVKPVDCTSCIGLCCKKGMIIPFTQDEVEYLSNRGTELDELPSGEYKLLTDCGNLREDEETATISCAAYEDPDRPAICRQFAPGSLACRVLRADHEIDSAHELNQYLEATNQVVLATQL